MSRYIVFLLSLLFPICTVGQIEINQDSGKIRLLGNSGVKAEYSHPATPFSSILNEDFSQAYDSNFVQEPDTVLWLKYTVVNTDSTGEPYYLFSNDAYYSVFLQTDSGWTKRSNGFMMPLSERSNKKDETYLKLSLPANEPTDIYIRLQASESSDYRMSPFMGTQLYFFKRKQLVDAYQIPGATFSLVYLSALMMITFFVFILFLSIRKRVYTYYLLYLGFQVIYAALVFADNPVIVLNILNFPPRFNYFILEGVQFIFVGFYVLFILELIDVPRFDLRLAKVMRGLAYFCFGYAIFSVIFHTLYPDPDIKLLFFRIVRIIVLPVNFVLIFWVVYKVKHPLVNYFIIGNVFFFTGSVLSFYVSFTGMNSDPESVFYFGNSLNTIFQMGLLGEVVCFSFAVAHHVRLIYREKEESSSAYIAQLQENQHIQETMNKELDHKISEKTAELIAVYSDIEKQREKEIKYTFSQKIKETELLALRAQMNPHFLFNSMNAIKHLILMDRPDDAMHYLDNFASLLRGVLQNSKRETITVEDELELLELYIILEKGRLGPSLDYEIFVEDRDELSQYAIPALLLQPFVENAIWHGLQPKKSNHKKLDIRFDTTKNLIISIQDNGIGREAAGQLKGKNNLHESFGIKITRERLALFNHLNEFNIGLEIKDLNENGSASGTLVKFTYSI